MRARRSLCSSATRARRRSSRLSGSSGAISGSTRWSRSSVAAPSTSTPARRSSSSARPSSRPRPSSARRRSTSASNDWRISTSGLVVVRTSSARTSLASRAACSGPTRSRCSARRGYTFFMAQAPALPRGFELPLAPRLPRIGSVDQVAVEQRAADLSRRSIKRESKLFALDLAVRMMDLTTLEGADTPVKVAALATAFPSGQSPLEIKVEEAALVAEMGAQEIDMVIDRGAFLSGNYAKVYDEVRRVKEVCGEAHLKVILETGELGTYDNVRRASLLAVAGGADFIKTSTGKI